MLPLTKGEGTARDFSIHCEGLATDLVRKILTRGGQGRSELDRDNLRANNAAALLIVTEIVPVTPLSLKMKPFTVFSPVALPRFLFLLTAVAAVAALVTTGSHAIAQDEKAGDEVPGKQPDQPKGDETPLDGLQEPAEDKPLQLKDESDAIDPSNKDALAWYMTGQKSLKQGNLQPAADAFRNAAKADPKSAVPLRALAMVLFRLGNVEEGLKTALKAMEQDPDDFQTRLELAVLFGTNRRFQDAVNLLEEALASKTLKQESFDFVHIHQVRGTVLLEMRNLSPAADSYEIILKALERPEDFSLTDREHKTLLKNRLTGYEVTGRILLEAGRVPKAIQAFEALSRTEQDAPGEHNLLLAKAYYQQDKLADCETNLDKYFESGHRSNDALQLLRDLYSASNRTDSLTAKLEELSNETADATRVKMFLGQTLLDQGKNSEASDVYQSILDSTGEADAYLGLVRVEIANRNPAALIATLNRAARSRITYVELTPLVSSVTTVDDFAKETVKTCRTMYTDKPDDLHAGVTYFCSLVAAELELADDETELLKATLELNPDRELSMETLDKYGMNRLKRGALETDELLQRGEYEMAAKIFEQMLATPGLPPGARVNTLFRISAAYASIKDLGAARKALKEALRLVPNEPQLLSRLALVEAADGKLETAEKLLLQVVEGLQENTELLVETRIQLAGIYAQMDQWDKSIEQYLHVQDNTDVDKDTLRLSRMGLSNAYVQSGAMEKGEKVLEEVYNEDPTEPGVNNDLGYLYADQGKNLEQAEKMIRIAVAAQPDNPAYLDSLGWVLFRLGKHEEALEPLKKANSDPDYQDSTLLEHQGDVHQALNQSDEAKQLWEKARKVEEEAKKPDETILKRLQEKLGIEAKADRPAEDASPEQK